MNYCYLHYKTFQDFIRASILITDDRTKPLEFRITSKIKIDDLQKMLYGDTLKEVLFSEKIGKELLESTQIDYEICLVKDKNLFGVRDFTDIPVLLLSKDDEFKAKDRYSVRIQSFNAKFGSLMAKFYPKDESSIQKLAKSLQESYKYNNILEPFDRIEKAMEFINNQEDDD